MKKEKNDIRVEMLRVEGDYAPFVQVDYMDKYAQEHTGLLLLDSGSSCNLLSCEMADSIGMLCKLEDDGATITAVTLETMDVDNAKFSFVLGGRMFHETFYQSKQQLPISVKGMNVIGIVGICFFQKHNLVIDYSDYTLHTSNVSPENLKISDCDFFFPMEIGLKYYGMPVLSVKQNGKEIVTLLDSGADGNMIAEKTLSDNNFEYQDLNERDFIYGVAGSVEVGGAVVGFNIVSVMEDDLCEISLKDYFSVLPDYLFASEIDDCDSNGDQLPPIEVALGSPFMAGNGWVLDFGAKIIYQLKDTFEYEEAV